MATYTINGSTFAQLKITDAVVTYKSGQADELVVTTDASATSTLAGVSLNGMIELLSDSTRIFRGRWVKRNLTRSGDRAVCQWTAYGPLYELDQNSPTSADNDAKVQLTNNLATTVEAHISQSGHLELNNYLCSAVTISPAQRFYEATKGDVLRYLLGLQASATTSVIYSTSTPLLNIVDDSLASPSALNISDAISFNLTTEQSTLSGFRTSYAVDTEYEFLQTLDYQKPGTSTTSTASKNYIALRDTVGTYSLGNRIMGVHREIDGQRKIRSFTYTDGTGLSLDGIFRNSSNYTSEAELKAIIQPVNGDYRDWTGQITTTSASLTVLKWFGTAPSSATIGSYRFSSLGVPFENMLRPTYSAAPYVALVRGQIYLRSGGSTTSDYVDVTFPAISAAVGYRESTVDSYTTPASGLSLQAYSKQNATRYSGTISARFSFTPNGYYDAVTYGGTTYRGVKQAAFDLKSEIVTYTFGATSDLSVQDGVRTLRDLR